MHNDTRFSRLVIIGSHLKAPVWNYFIYSSIFTFLKISTLLYVYRIALITAFCSTNKTSYLKIISEEIKSKNRQAGVKVIINISHYLHLQKGLTVMTCRVMIFHIFKCTNNPPLLLPHAAQLPMMLFISTPLSTKHNDNGN